MANVKEKISQTHAKTKQKSNQNKIRDEILKLFKRYSG
jgi:hypothetical protein